MSYKRKLLIRLISLLRFIIYIRVMLCEINIVCIFYHVKVIFLFY